VSFWSAFIGTGTNEGDMDEICVARITATAFAVLWTALLGLHMLSGS
jgi:hypothetical protein